LPDNAVAWLYRVSAIGDQRFRAARARSRHEATAAVSRRAVVRGERRRRLDAEAAARALTQLPPPQREMIVARIWGGLSFEEIATLMDSSISSVHRWYQRGARRSARKNWGWNGWPNDEVRMTRGASRG